MKSLIGFHSPALVKAPTCSLQKPLTGVTEAVGRDLSTAFFKVVALHPVATLQGGKGGNCSSDVMALLGAF